MKNSFLDLLQSLQIANNIIILFRLINILIIYEKIVNNRL